MTSQPNERPLRLRDRLPPGAFFGFLVIVLIFGLTFVVFSPRLRDRAAWQSCLAFYAQAHTEAESTAVDARMPSTGRGDAAAAINCGELARSNHP